MSLVLQLGNPSNWRDVYFQTTNAYRINESRYAPIPKIIVGSQLESQILAVYIYCSPPKPTWHFGGWLNQNVYTGLLVGGVPDAQNVQRQKIWLNRITVIKLEKLADSYSVSFDVPKWFESISIQLWEYIGPISDTTEVLIDELKTDILRLEGKIDAIN